MLIRHADWVCYFDLLSVLSERTSARAIASVNNLRRIEGADVPGTRFAHLYACDPVRYTLHHSLKHVTGTMQNVSMPIGETAQNQPPTNVQLAESLEQVSDLLREQGANPFRVEAYRKAAENLRGLDRPVWHTYEEAGLEGLEELPGVGRTISKALQQMIRGGRWALLERLKGNAISEQVFASVPNIGPVLAKKIHDELGLETLAELQAAAWDGRLAKLPGMGQKRIRAVRESLAARGRPQPIEGPASSEGEATVAVPVAELLDIDGEYREKAEKGKLPRIAPRRFNPTAENWLPIMHAERDDRHYTALFSNTARAHEMGTTHDWVVIYLDDDNRKGQHGRWTVITSTLGKLRGKRIVRGRESECVEFYNKRKPHELF